MIEARLIVRFQFDKDEYDNPREEDWGVLRWLALPSPGDGVGVTHDHDFNWLKVDRVRHFPLNPDAPERFLKSSPEGPVAHVIADYVGLGG